MRIELNVLEYGTEPGVSVQHQSALMMALRTGSIEVGSRRSEMRRLTFGAGEMCLVPRHVETWLRTDDLHYLYLSVDISDAALAAACDGTRGDVELRRVGKLVDVRVGALAAAVNAERVAGFPSGRLFRFYEGTCPSSWDLADFHVHCQRVDQCDRVVSHFDVAL
jgi:AraC family transcriptional regulator